MGIGGKRGKNDFLVAQNKRHVAAFLQGQKRG